MCELSGDITHNEARYHFPIKYNMILTDLFFYNYNLEKFSEPFYYINNLGGKPSFCHRRLYDTVRFLLG